MKNIKLTTLILIVLFFFSGKHYLIAQTNILETQSSDSTKTDKGDINLLVERVYLAFKAYKTGINGFDAEPKPVEIDSIRKTNFEKRMHTDPLLWKEKPIHPVLIKNGEIVTYVSISELNKIKIDSIESIEVMGVGSGISGLHGLNSNGIVLKLKTPMNQ